MKWLVIFTTVGLLLLFMTLDSGLAQREEETFTYIVHLDDGEHRLDIDIGVIASTPTTSSSTTLTTPTSPSSTTTTQTTVASSPTLTTVTSVTPTTSPTPTVTTNGTTTTATPITGTVPTTRNKTALALALLVLSYWLFKRRVRE